jgi:hypothetical protein
MKVAPTAARPLASVRARSALALACAAAVPSLACTAAAVGDTTAQRAPALRRDLTTAPAAPGVAPLAKSAASATLAQCATATAPQTERSASFAGEMNAVAGTARMLMRIDLQERASGAEALYRTVDAAGLGLWRGLSSPGVKTFAHIQQFTNLSAPAVYRAAIRFRWLNARGRVIKSEELHTPGCEQPAAPAASEAPASGASA